MKIVDCQVMNPSSELERLRRFVQLEVPGVMVASVHCRIHSVNGAELEHLTVGTLSRGRSHIETVMLPSIDPSLKFAFTNNDAALEVFQNLVEYPSLTELNLSFALVRRCPDDGRRLFSLVSAGRSISKLRITFTSAAMFNGLCISTAKVYAWRFFHTGLPILLEGSSLHSLTLEGREEGNESPRWMTYGFSRTVADSWALSVSRSDEKKVHHQFFPLEEIVALFPALAELRYHIHSRVFCRRCQCALINVVKRNRSLEKVDLGGGDYFFPTAALVSALGRNSSLKEFGPYLCSSVEEFRALMRVFTPERQANTTLSTLKVRLPAVVPVRDSFEVLLWGNPLLHSVTTLKQFELQYGLDVDHVVGWRCTLMGSTLKLSLPKMNSRDALLPVMLDCMLSLGAALRMNDSRLQRVELSQESHWPAAGLTMGSASHAREERDVQSAIGVRLEQIRENELRQNTRLQSLQLGWWRVVRTGGAGDRWETKYAGPCLDWPVQQEEYVVKVRMRR